MRVQKTGLGVLLFAFMLNGQTPRERQWKPMDIWEALDISLKGAKSIRPRNGYVPDEGTAIKIGEAVAIAQYGEKTISTERPFRARLRGNTWFVIGTLHPEGALGGTAVIKIRKDDGRILFLTHQY